MKSKKKLYEKQHNNSRLISPITKDMKRSASTHSILPVKNVPRAKRSTEYTNLMFWSRTVHSDLWTLKRAQLVCSFLFKILFSSFFSTVIHFGLGIFLPMEHHLFTYTKWYKHQQHHFIFMIVRNLIICTFHSVILY